MQRKKRSVVRSDKLALRRETMRRLDRQELRNVRGGQIQPSADCTIAIIDTVPV